MSAPELHRWLLLAMGGLLLAVAAEAAPPGPAVPLDALIVGGGPDVESNAAQIEGHVHFVAGLLPPAAKRVVLFADGKAKNASVSYADRSAGADAKRALDVLLGDQDDAEPILNRAPALGVPMDGPARLAEVRRALARLSAQAAHEGVPLLLYFAGHGTQDEKNEADTDYDLWAGDALKVRNLADELARAPRQVPIVLVMAQCFSGAFADLLFKHGDPKGAMVEQDVVGFFSARKDREASGCSYETERDDYQDFSSYFFGALAGKDRFGGTIQGADFDGDGHVSLHEAFCYALIHDPSADTPVCTSDAFLKRFAPLQPEAIYPTAYHEACQAATPAQRAALDALSAQVGLTGEARALAVYDRLTYSDPVARASVVQRQAEAKQKLNDARLRALAPLLARVPALRWLDKSPEDQAATDQAVAELTRNQSVCRELLEAEKVWEESEDAADAEEAALQRFAALYEHVVEAAQLRAHGKDEIKANFERLWKAEQRTLPLASP